MRVVASGFSTRKPFTGLASIPPMPVLRTQEPGQITQLLQRLVRFP